LSSTFSSSARLRRTPRIHPEKASPYRLCIGVNSEHTLTLTLTFAQWNEVNG